MAMSWKRIITGDESDTVSVFRFKLLYERKVCTASLALKIKILDECDGTGCSSFDMIVAGNVWEFGTRDRSPCNGCPYQNRPSYY